MIAALNAGKINGSMACCGVQQHVLCKLQRITIPTVHYMGLQTTLLHFLVVTN
jgi:hypothetical protein